MYEITIRGTADEIRNNIEELAGLMGGVTPSQEKAVSTVDTLGSKPCEETEKTVSFDTLRALMAELTRSGKREGVKAILQSFKVEKLTELKEKDFSLAYKNAIELKEGAA